MAAAIPITKMALKAWRKRVTITCDSATAYLVERALMHYGDSMVDVSPKLAVELCDMAYSLQRIMIAKGMTTDSDREVYSKAAEVSQAKYQMPTTSRLAE